MEASFRENRCAAAADQPYDVVIAGGGISGAAIFAQLTRDGYRTLLVDAGDFGSGTSQQSAMMIWGGLLYLTRFDLMTVYRLCRDRDALLANYPEAVRAQYYRYLPLKRGWQPRPLVKGLLDFYRLVGGMRRSPNRIETHFDEEALVAQSRYRGSVAYEEAMLTHSDARFVIDLIRSHETSASIPLNYVGLEEGEYDPSRRQWRLALRDQFAGKDFTVTTRVLVNAAGAKVDELNRRFAIASPYKHIFSKGVFLSFARPPGHDTPLVFELGQNRDVILYVPWGPISYWGPTETATHDLTQASEPTGDEVRFLLEQANCALNQPVTARDIIAYRSGVRQLAVAANYQGERYPLEHSRHHRLHIDGKRPWVAVYGGKFTSAFGMAQAISLQVARLLGNAAARPRQSVAVPAPPHTLEYPGLPGKFPSIDHCVKHEYCLTIGDYLRRRTNIAQWVARNGLGMNNQYQPFVEQLAAQLPHAQVTHMHHTASHYVAETQRIFERLHGY